MNAPNILLLMADQWRGDCLGTMGHPVVKTPHLDELARQGIAFTRAYSATPSCVPARAALLTGLQQKNHGFVGYDDDFPWNYDTTLAQTFAQNGYHTQCVGKMHVFPARKLLGFHNVLLHDGYLHRDRGQAVLDDYCHWLKDHAIDADYTDSGIGCNGYAVHPWPYAEMEHPSAWVTSQSIHFLRRRDPSKPFLLLSSYHRPHPPLDPPQSVFQRYQSLEVPESPCGDWVEHPQQRRHALDSPVPHSPADIADAKRAYYAQMTFIDAQINRLTMALHEHGVLDNTIIVFTADHGDMLYDHRYIAKILPFEGSCRIPLLLYLPPKLREKWRAEPGMRLAAVTELRDIFPSLCELSGIPIPESIDGLSITSLLPAAPPSSPPWRDYLHGEHSAGAESNHWLTDGTEKYCWFSQNGRELLFNLHEDPQECHNLAGCQPERIQFWRKRLCRELAGREEGYVQGGTLQKGKQAKAVLRKSRNRKSPQHSE